MIRVLFISAGRIAAALAMLLAPALAARESTSGVEKIADVSHPQLGEMSGIVASSYPDIYWVHNDSGDSARIFAMRTNGEVVVPGYYRFVYPDNSPADWPGYAIDNAWQYDWEDIAMADGVLYLADIGNNDNARRDLGVYVVNEPNPMYVGKTRASRFIPVRYPDQEEYPARLWHFDCEAVFTFKGKLYFLTKHRQPGKALSWEPGAKLYRLDTKHTDRDNVLTLEDQHDGISLATGADVSPDGNHLAVLTYTKLWVFDRPRRGDRWFRSPVRTLELDREVVRQNEAIAWESNETLLMTNENRGLFRVSLSALAEQ